MFARRWLWLSVLLSLSVSVGSAALANDNKGGNRVIEARGAAQVKAATATNYRSLATGTIVRQGDILFPSDAARVTVLCADSRIWQVPPGVPSGVSNGCPKASLARTRRILTPNLGGQDETIPYILSPRFTYLRDHTPSFRWHPVPGAKSYTVRLLAANLGELWQVQTQGTELTYPKDVKPLEWGVGYLLTVEAEGGKSSLADGGWNLGFKLLDDRNTRKVEQEIASLEASANLSPAAKAIALAEIYRNSYLVSEAIALLQDTIDKGQVSDPNQRGLIYVQLGELQAETGLNLLAEANLTQAADLFRQSQNQQGLANAQAGLSVVQLLLGKNPESEQAAQQTRATYQALGDAENSREFEEILQRAKQKRQQQVSPAGASDPFSLAGQIDAPSPE